MARFWISWNEPLPLPTSAPEHWVTGYGDDYATVCAVIDAPDPFDAELQIKNVWKPSQWRFCVLMDDDWQPPADRFPPQERAMEIKYNKVENYGSMEPTHERLAELRRDSIFGQSLWTRMESADALIARIRDLEAQLKTAQEELEAMRETLAGPYFFDEDKRSDLSCGAGYKDIITAQRERIRDLEAQVAAAPYGKLSPQEQRDLKGWNGKHKRVYLSTRTICDFDDEEWPCMTARYIAMREFCAALATATPPSPEVTND